MATLLIGWSDSACGSCHRPANPQERGHYTMLGYASTNGKPGCGEEWDDVIMTYTPFTTREQWGEYLTNCWFPGFIKDMLRKKYLKED